MDNLIEDYKSISEEIESFMQIKTAKLEAIEEQYESKVSPLKNNLAYITAQLRVLAEQVPQKETKTQCKVELLSGSVVIKKPTKTLVADKNKLIEWATEHAQDQYIDEKVVKSFKWKEYKSELTIVDDVIIDKNTGEVVDVGVSIEEKPEEVVIK